MGLLDDLDRKYGFAPSTGSSGGGLSDLDKKYGFDSAALEEQKRREEEKRRQEEQRKAEAQAARAARAKEMLAGGSLPSGQIEQAMGTRLPTGPAPSAADTLRSVADPVLFAGTHALPMAAAAAKGMGLDAGVGLLETAARASQGPPGMPMVPTGTNPAPVTHALREKLDEVTGGYLAEDPGVVRTGLLGLGEAGGVAVPVGEVSTAGKGTVAAGASLGKRLVERLPRAASEAALFGLGSSAETQDPIERAKEVGAMTVLGGGLGSLGAIAEHVRVRNAAKDTVTRLAEEKAVGEATSPLHLPREPQEPLPSAELPKVEPAPELAPSLVDRRANELLRQEVENMTPAVQGKTVAELNDLAKTAQPGSPLAIAIERAKQQAPVDPLHRYEPKNPGTVVEAPDLTYRGTKMFTESPEQARMYTIKDESGEDVGYLLAHQEEGGFKVKNVFIEEGARGKDYAEQLYLQAARDMGPYIGPTDYAGRRTAAGERMNQRLRRTVPEVFGEQVEAVAQQPKPSATLTPSPGFDSLADEMNALGRDPNLSDEGWQRYQAIKTHLEEQAKAEGIKTGLSDEEARAAQRAAYGGRPASERDVVVVPPVEETAPAVVRTPAATEQLAAAPPLVTGIKNAVTEVERASRGLPEIEVAARGGFGQDWMDRAKDKVDRGELDPRLLAAQLDHTPRPLNDEEDAALLYDRMRLYNEHRSVDDQIEKALAAGDDGAVADLRSQRAVIQDAIDLNDRAVKKAGTENGRGLAARRMMIAQDYTLPAVLQRARVAKGSQLSAAEEARFAQLTSELEVARKALDEHKEQVAQLQAEKAIAQMAATEQRRRAYTARTSRRSATRAELDSQFDSLREQFGRAASTPRMGLDPELVKLLGAMAVNRVQAGITDAAQLVDHVYQAVKDHVDGLTIRDVRDAISGYGITNQPSKEELNVLLREAKRQMRLFSALEDAESGKRPLKSGFQHDPESDRVMELRRQVTEAMRKHGIQIEKPLDPEQQMKSSLDAVKTRLRRQIAQLDEQLKTGKKPAPRTPIQYDKEAVDLRAQRDRLQEALDAASDDKVMPDQRIAGAERALGRAIEDLEARIKAKDIGPARQQTVAPWSPKIAELRKRHGQLADTMRALRDAARPPKDPELARRMAYRNGLEHRIAELEGKLATGDYSRKPKPQPLPIDAETRKRQEHYQRLKQQIDYEREKLEMGSRTPVERAADLLTRIYRAQLLSSVKTLGKIGAAAGMRTVTTPVEGAVWSLWRKMPGLDRVDQLAPREGGGLSLQAEAKAFASLLDPNTYREAYKKATTGRSQADVLAGKADHPVLSGEWLEFFGRLHGAIKEVPRQNEIVRAAEKRYLNFARTEGRAPEGAELAEIYAAAVGDGNRAIFMNDNWLTNRYQRILNDIQHQDKWWSTPVHTSLKLTLPIVKVPTNFVGEVTSYAAGFPKAAFTLIMRRGVEKLTPEEADYVARNISKGTVGLGIMALGYMNADNIGGYYSRGDKREEGDVKPGGARVLGVDIPRFLLHTPALEMLQIGATLRRVVDAHQQQGLSDTRAAMQGGLDVTRGLAEEVPFFEEPMRAWQAAESTSGVQAYAGSVVRGLTVPPDVQRVARAMDTDAKGNPVKRYPRNMLEEIQTGIPVLREHLPAHREPPRHFKMDVWGETSDEPTPITKVLNAEADRIDRPVEFVRRNPVDPFSHGGQRAEMAPKVYERYIRTAGQRAQQDLYRLVSDPSWQQLPLDDQQDQWERTLRIARHMALLDVLRQERDNGRR